MKIMPFRQKRNIHFLIFIFMKKNIYSLAMFAIIFWALHATPLRAQVTVGSLDDPQNFSILELISGGNRGMRLPQLTTAQRDALVFTGHEAEAQGLQIFNTTTKCVETWNGAVWIQECNGEPASPPLAPTAKAQTLCGSPTVADLVATGETVATFNWYAVPSGGSPLASTTVLTVGTTTYYVSQTTASGESERTEVAVEVTASCPSFPSENTTWTTDYKWVGAFWRQDQTGERVIASKNSNYWKAEVYEPSSSGEWLTLHAGGSLDPAIWSASPGDAEDYKLPTTQTAEITGYGNILFRIGATSVNPNDTTNSGYKIYNTTTNKTENGKKPRYAKVLVRTGAAAGSYTTCDTIFCRQGEAADYVFTTTDTYGGSTARLAAVKFSPYNLTGADLNDDDKLAYSVGYQGGVFVDFPTKVGAFFQWVNTTNTRYAYHPTKPTGALTGWDNNYPSTYWNTLSGTHETCPKGWVRPNDGTTSANSSGGIEGSQMRQSLHAVPPTGTSASTSGAYWGYYADGYFDRRTITGSDNSVSYSTVSKSTKDAAYCGRLFTNPVVTSGNYGASVFMPGGGYRDRALTGGLKLSGSYGDYWSSSAYTTYSCWGLYLRSSEAGQHDERRPAGFSVRCVSE
jgi:hypothetical protein